MRLALVSPYSWTYPGGVNRHIQALAEQFIARDHEVRVFAPFDHDTRRSTVLHRGARPHALTIPEWLVPLGGTVGWPSNGAISNVALHPTGVSLLRRELRAFDPDVVHIHEPNAPTPGWDTLMTCDAPMVGTFHTYSTSTLPFVFANFGGLRRRLNRLSVRIAVSDAAAWTGRRFQGGEYRIIPNGVELQQVSDVREPGPARFLFIGQGVERKGLPVLLAAFDALRHEVAAELTVIGAEVPAAPGVRVLGRVDDNCKHAELRRADVLVAPSLGGESFGMVLTEAFASGTPVVASDIAGYRDIVRDGVDGRLVPPGDATALAQALLDATHAPEALRRASVAARQHAEQFAWPVVAGQVEETYRDALELPRLDTAAARLGVVPITGEPRRPAQRIAPLDPVPARLPALARKGALVGAGGLAAMGAVWGLHRIGLRPVLDSLVNSQPSWVVFALGLMCLAMVFRAISWHALLRGAMPEAHPRFADAMQGTSIGVLMSATLPARLGEPARALVVARRLGRARERLPAVIGTLVGQTLVNVFALAALGATLFADSRFFTGKHHVLIWYALTPVAMAAVVLAAPRLFRTHGRQVAARLRSGLTGLKDPRLGTTAVSMQLVAWALQFVACYLLLVALGLEHVAGVGAAAAVLFAVNVSAVLPVTPSNLGVFQAACVAVLSGAYGVHSGDALAYGIVLQCVEVATAIVMGTPALVREGLSWKDMRVRTMWAAPIVLRPRQERDAELGRDPSRG